MTVEQREFQPTLPLRGATRRFEMSLAARSFQPTLPLRGATEASRSSTDASQFQPTLPLRGATSARTRHSECLTCFNPRSPCGERPGVVGVHVVGGIVSTHAPLAGSDAADLRGPVGRRVSTHAPLAGSDGHDLPHSSAHHVSTHAPLAGSDEHNRFHILIKLKFQPTLPLRGATRTGPSCADRARWRFNPRSPCGERRRRPW